MKNKKSVDSITDAGAGIGGHLGAMVRIPFEPCCFERRKTTGQQSWAWILVSGVEAESGFSLTKKGNGRSDYCQSESS